PHPFDKERRQEVEAVLAPAVVPCAAKIRFRPQLPLLPPTMTKIHADPASLASCFPLYTPRSASVFSVLVLSFASHRHVLSFAFRADSTRFSLTQQRFSSAFPLAVARLPHYRTCASDTVSENPCSLVLQCSC